MLRRPLMMTGMLGAAAGVPYAVSNAPQDWQQWIPQQPAQVDPQAAPVSQPPVAGPQPLRPIDGPQFPNSLIYESPAPLEGAGFYSMEQVLRMDISKQWVYQNWARKSTGLADPELFGVRVPLVTGTGMADLAGSLSYYFNGAGQVDRIRFRGTTADTSRLVSFLQRQYGLQWQSPRVPGEQLLQARSGDQIVSQMNTFPEPVLWSTRPHGSFRVELELNRPGSGRYVEQPGPKLIVPEPKQTVAQEAPVEKADKPPVAAETAGALEHARRPEFRWPN